MSQRSRGRKSRDSDGAARSTDGREAIEFVFTASPLNGINVNKPQRLIAVNRAKGTKRALVRACGLVAGIFKPAKLVQFAFMEPRGGAMGEDASWIEDLAPISEADWSYERARHLLDRAGFGGAPDDVARLARMTPNAAVASLVDYQAIGTDRLKPFEHSGVYDPTLTPFPPTRPAATRLAAETGAAMGVAVKPSGSRRLQPVADRFFYWLRASALETRRVANWWAGRMVVTERPLEEKMALFWHGHFACGAEKVRDYRKMLGQVVLFQRHATGNFRELLVAVAQDPAMLVFLDAGQNVKGAPNENFGREVMELFTMGVGSYTEHDIREAARAFTGWRDDDLTFRVDEAKHDDGSHNVPRPHRPFRRRGHPRHHPGPKGHGELHRRERSTASWCARICHRRCKGGLARCCARTATRVTPFLRTIFLSRDFYSPPSVGTHIKGPVELIVSTYRRLGLTEMPGVPDFNAASGELGQVLLDPPNSRGMGARTRLDHAWNLARPRQLRARGRAAGHDRFRRSEPDPRPGDAQDERPHPERHGHQRRHQRARARHGAGGRGQGCGRPEGHG